MSPTWLTLFIDLAPGEHTLGTTFWLGAPGYTLSPVRGEHGEFATLVPPHGEDHLRIQRLGSTRSGTHLDVHVAHSDVDAGAAEAISLGAELVARPVPGLVLLRSPAGYPFCVLGSPGGEVAPPLTWPDGHRSRVDQLCLDIPPVAYEVECEFWAALTGWPVTGTSQPEFRRLQTPAELPLRVLLQRLDDPADAATGHLDIATDDRDAEVARLAALGARVAGDGAEWTVLRPPVGPEVCVTDRSPGR